MMTWINYGVVLAQSNRLRAMGSGLRGRRAKFDMGDMLTLGLVLAIIGVVIYLLYKYTESQGPSRSFNRPRSLFSSLAKAHGLDWRSRSLLKKLARFRGLTFAAQLFLRPDCFDTSRLNPPLQPHAKEIEDLYKRIFSEELTGKEVAGPEKGIAQNKVEAAGPAQVAPAASPTIAPLELDPGLASPTGDSPVG